MLTFDFYRHTLSHCEYWRYLQAYIVTLWIHSICTGIHCHIVNILDFYKHTLSHCERFRFIQAYIVTLWTLSIFTGINCHIANTFDFYRHKLSHCEYFRFLQAYIVTLWTFSIFYRHTLSHRIYFRFFFDAFWYTPVIMYCYLLLCSHHGRQLEIYLWVFLLLEWFFPLAETFPRCLTFTYHPLFGNEWKRTWLILLIQVNTSLFRWPSPFQPSNDDDADYGLHHHHWAVERGRVSSDVGWHIRGKQWRVRKHGSVLLYVHRNRKVH